MSNWSSSSMDVHYPYNSAGSFMEYFQGLTFEHVNFIFDGHAPEESTSSLYKFGASRTGSSSYYDPSLVDELLDHGSQIDHSFGRSFDEVHDHENITTHGTPVDCLRRHHSDPDYQAVWQDMLDPDSMTYEELLELGETVGTQNRGLSKELISSLPISKYKCCFFSRRKSRNERCVICQMEYKRGEKLITLPCKHIYHAGCGSKWLSINKACPICYTEVSSGASNIKE
ncbi:E3 ubiquitin-protein ligase BIG BROTHER [Linum grandiflorum]